MQFLTFSSVALLSSLVAAGGGAATSTLATTPATISSGTITATMTVSFSSQVLVSPKTTTTTYSYTYYKYATSVPAAQAAKCTNMPAPSSGYKTHFLNSPQYLDQTPAEVTMAAKAGAPTSVATTSPYLSSTVNQAWIGYCFNQCYAGITCGSSGPQNGNSIGCECLGAYAFNQNIPVALFPVCATNGSGC